MSTTIYIRDQGTQYSFLLLLLLLLLKVQYIIIVALNHMNDIVGL
jgi:hypothetical protein